MKKTSLLLLVILIVIVLGGAGFYIWYQQNKGDTQNTNVNESTVNINANLGAPTITNDNWAPAETGDITVNKSATYKNVTFNLTTASKPTTFRSKTADEGKQYVVVYTGAIPLVGRDVVTTWVRNDVTLTDSAGTSYPVALYGLISEYSTPTETGYFAFTTPTASKTFTLHFGTGEGSQSVVLGF